MALALGYRPDPTASTLDRSGLVGHDAPPLPGAAYRAAPLAVRTGARVREHEQPGLLAPVSAADLANKLLYGDNLDILRSLASESVDLVYLDPPWNPKADYNVIFRDESGRKNEAQRAAFGYTWHWGPIAEDHFGYLTQTGRHHGAVPSPVSTLIAALRSAIGPTQITAYVVEMTVRLVELHRVLQPTGSLYLHSDATVSHYLKLVLDALFGGQQFRNEIIWKRTSAHNTAKRYGPVHDVLLFYGKSGDVTWNQLVQPYSDSYVASHYKNVDGSGRRYRLNDITGPGTRNGPSGQPWRGFDPTTIGRHWTRVPDDLDKMDAEGLINWPKRGGWPSVRRHLSGGVPMQDVWTDIAPLNSQARERTGWGTQKPLVLLQRVIEASSNPGDLVLDPFCGCGTAIDAAQGLQRRWIGIDFTWHAIEVMKARMQARHGIVVPVEGAPTEVEGARRMAEQVPNGRDQFEAWALSLVGAVPHGGPQKKGADQGADGVVTFSGPGGSVQSAIVSVKSGHVNSGQVQQLKGAMERHGGSIGLFVTLEEPSKPMRQEAATAGLFHSVVSGLDYPRLQVLSIADMLERGRKPVLPPMLDSAYRATFWSDDEVPAELPQRRQRPASPRRGAQGSDPIVVPVSPLAVELRDEYAKSASPAEQQPLPSTKRGQPVPQPSPGSGVKGLTDRI